MLHIELKYNANELRAVVEFNIALPLIAGGALSYAGILVSALYFGRHVNFPLRHAFLKDK